MCTDIGPGEHLTAAAARPVPNSAKLSRFTVRMLGDSPRLIPSYWSFGGGSYRIFGRKYPKNLALCRTLPPPFHQLLPPVGTGPLRRMGPT